MLPIFCWPCASNMDIATKHQHQNNHSDSQFFNSSFFESDTDIGFKMEPVVPLVPLPWNGGCVCFKHFFWIAKHDCFVVVLRRTDGFQWVRDLCTHMHSKIAGGCVSCTGGVWTLFFAQLPASPVTRVTAWDSESDVYTVATDQQFVLFIFPLAGHLRCYCLFPRWAAVIRDRNRMRFSLKRFRCNNKPTCTHFSV